MVRSTCTMVGQRQSRPNPLQSVPKLVLLPIFETGSVFHLRTMVNNQNIQVLVLLLNFEPWFVNTFRFPIAHFRTMVRKYIQVVFFVPFLAHIVLHSALRISDQPPTHQTDPRNPYMSMIQNRPTLTPLLLPVIPK